MVRCLTGQTCGEGGPDKQITRESGVLDLLEAGDNLMVDRGFDISNIVPNGVSVNIPPFLAGGRRAGYDYQTALITHPEQANRSRMIREIDDLEIWIDENQTSFFLTRSCRGNS